MYTLSDFASIHKQNNHVLSNEIKQRIQMLCNSIGATPKFSILVQNKISLQDCIREINKLTHENKSVQIPIILEIVASNSIGSFMDIFFTIIHKNSFYSSIYTELYHTLETSYDLTPYFTTKFETYIESIKNICTVDTVNYDEYCKNHTINEERRTFTLFLMNLNSSVHYTSTLETVFSQVEKYVDSNKEIMNELVELLYILKPKDERIVYYANLRPTDHPGINHKIIFRFHDILSVQ